MVQGVRDTRPGGSGADALHRISARWMFVKIIFQNKRVKSRLILVSDKHMLKILFYSLISARTRCCNGSKENSKNRHIHPEL